jgi:hypothetical protein
LTKRERPQSADEYQQKITEEYQAAIASNTLNMLRYTEQRDLSPANLSMIAFTTRVAAHPSTAGDVEKASRKRWIGLMRPFLLQHHEDGLEQDA